MDQILADEAYSGGTSTWRWTLTDHEGSVRDIVDAANGTIVNHKKYDSFGRMTGETDTAASADVIFGWTGQQTDDETGLQQKGARYYDPNIGRFISADPSGFSGGDYNLYRYVGNDPLNWVDPSGLSRTINQLGNSNNDLAGLADHLDRLEAEFGDRGQQPGLDFSWMPPFSSLLDDLSLASSYDSPGYSVDSFIDPADIWTLSSQLASDPGLFSMPSDNSILINPIAQYYEEQHRAQTQRAHLELVGAHLVGSSGFNPWLDPGPPVDVLPEAITAREHGVLRGIGAGFAAVAGSALSETGVGLALLAWSIDQAKTARNEIWYGKPFQSTGTQLIRSALGDGLAGDAGALAYENFPLFVAPMAKVPYYGRVAAPSRGIGLASEGIGGQAIDPARFAQMKAAFQRSGGVIDQSPGAQGYLRLRQAEGLTFNAKTILLPERPSTTAVFEEFIHTAQHRTGRFSTAIDRFGTAEAIRRMEIEAAQKLIRNRNAWQIPNAETRQTIQRLRALQNE